MTQMRKTDCILYNTTGKTQSFKCQHFNFELVSHNYKKTCLIFVNQIGFLVKESCPVLCFFCRFESRPNTDLTGSVAENMTLHTVY